MFKGNVEYLLKKAKNYPLELFLSNHQKIKRFIMRLIQNLKIRWEMNFYVKNACEGKVITKKIFWPKTTLFDPSIGP
jgi:hypothetical protein